MSFPWTYVLHLLFSVLMATFFVGKVVSSLYDQIKYILCIKKRRQRPQWCMHTEERPSVSWGERPQEKPNCQHLILDFLPSLGYFAMAALADWYNPYFTYICKYIFYIILRVCVCVCVWVWGYIFKFFTDGVYEQNIWRLLVQTTKKSQIYKRTQNTIQHTNTFEEKKVIWCYIPFEQEINQNKRVRSK